MYQVTNGVKEEVPLQIWTRSDRQTREYAGNSVGNYHPPEKAELRHGPWRPGVYMQNWAGGRNWQSWTVLTQSNARDAQHVQIRDRQIQKTLATRLWLLDQRARTPIPVSRYNVNTTALMPGNVRAQQGG